MVSLLLHLILLYFRIMRLVNLIFIAFFYVSHYSTHLILFNSTVLHGNSIKP